MTAVVVLCGTERDEWELPGGKLEPEVAGGVRRSEVREETGWHVELLALLDVWVYVPVPNQSVFVADIPATR